ncbi:hypothetical protein CF327_g2664 [Tilletia walkeri]|uniref:Extracellular membrane protein CFEM domain-containing protein n=1 Tax=Tilletia walkeri TaxID=117179 RepID=A0A8X7NDX4_9BASI|nr:hypothetical protein CF327_g2664 [Tilletia walkeri]KAE8270231.1 hypothetical protein A4X09_0g2103 [Tilletia walkeri]
MRLTTLSSLAAVFTASVANCDPLRPPADSSAFSECINDIPKFCPGVPASDTEMYKYPTKAGGPAAFYKCMFIHWSLPTRAKCRSDDVGCRCYEGCVQEMAKSESDYVNYAGVQGDVVGMCKAWCGLGAPALKCR